MHILFCVPLLLNLLGKYQVANIVENIDDRNNPMDTGKKHYIFLFDSFLNIMCCTNSYNISRKTNYQKYSLKCQSKDLETHLTFKFFFLACYM